jgi:hypothetical protein
MQTLVVPAAHALLADMILRRVRKQAARAGKWTCPVCETRTISANAATCLACTEMQLPKE